MITKSNNSAHGTPKIISKAEAKARGFKFYFTGKPCPNGGVSERRVSSGNCTCSACKKSHAERERHRYQALAELGMAPHQVAPEKSRAANRKAYEAKMTPERLAAKRAREADPEGHQAMMRERRRQKERERDARRRADPEKMKKKRETERMHRATPMGKLGAATRYKAWAESNPDRIYEKRARRRVRKLSATASWDSELTEFVTREAADLARRREEATGFAWHVDHIVPLQAREACGLHVWNNLQVIPAPMNIGKKNKMLLTAPGEWITRL